MLNIDRVRTRWGPVPCTCIQFFLCFSSFFPIRFIESMVPHHIHLFIQFIFGLPFKYLFFNSKWIEMLTGTKCRGEFIAKGKLCMKPKRKKKRKTKDRKSQPYLYKYIAALELEWSDGSVVYQSKRSDVYSFIITIFRCEFFFPSLSLALLLFPFAPSISFRFIYFMQKFSLCFSSVPYCC